MKVILYARFSPRRDEDTSESNEAQFRQMRAWAEAEGHEVVGEFEDRAMSGSDARRPGLWAAVESTKRGYTLVVTELSRLARSMFDSVMAEAKLKKAGATYISLKGEGTWDDDPNQKLQRRILQAFAEWWVGNHADVTSARMNAHQNAGRRMSSICPYGWKQDPEDPARMLKEPHERAVITQIIRLRNQGHSLRGIASVLSDNGIRCRGGPWHHGTIRNILRRERHKPVTTSQVHPEQ